MRTFRFLVSLFCFLISAAEGGPGVEKTSFASNASGDLSGQAPNPRLVLAGEQRTEIGGQDLSSVLRHPYSGYRMRFLFTMSDIGGQRTDDGGRIVPSSASRPSLRPSVLALGETDKLASEGSDERCSAAEEVPRGLPISPSVLRHPFPVVRMVEPDGIEPTTSCLQSTRSPN
jgi:hypothetical protein